MADFGSGRGERSTDLPLLLNAESFTQEEIDERLRLKRKTRGQKACYPW